MMTGLPVTTQDYYPPPTLAPDTVQPFPGYPLHSMSVAATQYEYDYHLDRYFRAHAHYMSWYDYCMTAAYGRYQSSLFYFFYVEFLNYGIWWIVLNFIILVCTIELSFCCVCNLVMC